MSKKIKSINVIALIESTKWVTMANAWRTEETFIRPVVQIDFPVGKRPLKRTRVHVVERSKYDDRRKTDGSRYRLPSLGK